MASKRELLKRWSKFEGTREKRCGGLKRAKGGRRRCTHRTPQTQPCPLVRRLSIDKWRSSLVTSGRCGMAASVLLNRTGDEPREEAHTLEQHPSHLMWRRLTTCRASAPFPHPPPPLSPLPSPLSPLPSPLSPLQPPLSSPPVPHLLHSNRPPTHLFDGEPPHCQKEVKEKRQEKEKAKARAHAFLEPGKRKKKNKRRKKKKLPRSSLLCFLNHEQDEAVFVPARRLPCAR